MVSNTVNLAEPVFQVRVMAAPQSADGDLVLPCQLLAFQLVVNFLASFVVDASWVIGGSLVACCIAAFAES